MLIQLNFIEQSFYYLIIAFLSTFGIALVYSLIIRRSKKLYIFTGIILLLVSFSLGQIIIELTSPYDFIIDTIGKIPLSLFNLTILSVGIGESLIFIKIIFKKEELLKEKAIKESMDNLPEGVCFSLKDGTPLLVNRRMHLLSYDLFGKILLNSNLFHEKLNNDTFLDEVAILHKDPTIILKIKDKIWNIRRLEYESINETIASEITQEWQLVKEIDEKNERLRELNQRLKEYNSKVETYTREKEILDAKIKIHDDRGRALISLNNYLEKANPGPEDRASLIKLWKESNLILKEDKIGKEDSNLWEELTLAAISAGVEIILKGELPKNKKVQGLFLDLVHECLHNAIRHAQASTLNVKINKGKSDLFIEISNNGIPPQDEITEKGGLKNLRNRIELEGGDMKIQGFPNFILKVRLPKGGQDEI